MANSDTPKGLKPLRYLSGAPYNGKVRMYLLPSSDGTATFIGDAVTLAGGGGAAGTVVYGYDVEGMPTIKQAAAGSTPVGVVVDFLPNPDSLAPNYRTSSTNRIALVCDDPNVVFEVQEDSVTSTLAATDIGTNADITVGSGSTTTGISAMELDSTTTSTVTATLRVLGLVRRPDNAIGSHAKWEVIFNEHMYKGTTGV